MLKYEWLDTWDDGKVIRPDSGRENWREYVCFGKTGGD